MKARFLATTGAMLLASATWAPAQTGGAANPAAQASNKIAVINVRMAIVTTAEGKLAQAELQSQFSARQAELENLRKRIDDAQVKLRSTSVSDDEKAKIARQLDYDGRMFQRKQDDLREDVQAAENDVVDVIGRKLVDVVDRYARENGYSVVLDVSSQTTSVIYASTQVDVTQDIIRLYDQSHPVKAAPAQPGQTRQPSAQPRPPQQPPKPPQQ